MSSDKKQNLQDAFLNAVRKSKTPLTVFLVNGVKLQGVDEDLWPRRQPCNWSGVA